MSAEACKIIIDRSSQTTGRLMCLLGNTSLYGSTNNGPTMEEAESIAKDMAEVDRKAIAIVDRMNNI